MRIAKKKKGDTRVIEVSGTLTVANSLKLKKALAENLKKGSRLELIITDVSEMDLSFIQLLVAAMKKTETGDREFKVKTPVPDLVVENLKLSGFLNHNSCAKPDCVWCSILEQVQGA